MKPWLWVYECVCGGLSLSLSRFLTLLIQEKDGEERRRKSQREGEREREQYIQPSEFHSENGTRAISLEGKTRKGTGERERERKRDGDGQGITHREGRACPKKENSHKDDEGTTCGMGEREEGREDAKTFIVVRPFVRPSAPISRLQVRDPSVGSLCRQGHSGNFTTLSDWIITSTLSQRGLRLVE